MLTINELLILQNVIIMKNLPTLTNTPAGYEFLVLKNKYF